VRGTHGHGSHQSSRPEGTGPFRHPFVFHPFRVEGIGLGLGFRGLRPRLFMFHRFAMGGRTGRTEAKPGEYASFTRRRSSDPGKAATPLGIKDESTEQPGQKNG
jgi:hypothetical protein